MLSQLLTLILILGGDSFPVGVLLKHNIQIPSQHQERFCCFVSFCFMFVVRSLSKRKNTGISTGDILVLPHNQDKVHLQQRPCTVQKCVWLEVNLILSVYFFESVAIISYSYCQGTAADNAVAYTNFFVVYVTALKLSPQISGHWWWKSHEDAGNFFERERGKKVQEALIKCMLQRFRSWYFILSTN